MPHPIPRWDLVRVAVQYLHRRQQRDEPTTLEQLSKRLGVGVKTILDLLEDEKVVYSLYGSAKKSYTKSRIFVSDLPEHLEMDFGISRSELIDSSTKMIVYEMNRIAEVYKEEEEKKVLLEQAEKMRRRYFLAE